ncbi:MAG: arginine--tRNA ligase [Thermoproteota archaeon]
MGFLEEAERIRAEVNRTLEKFGYSVEARVEEPPSQELGELATPVAFDLAKKYRENPVKLADTLVNALETDRLKLVENARNVNGFVNFKFKRAEYSTLVINEVLSKAEEYGKHPVASKKILIEHTNSNPNKALHIGTLRNAIIGDVLARLLRFLGHDVMVVNYIDDSGSQVADNIVAHYYLKVPLEPPGGEKFDEYCGKVYAEYSDKIESSEELRKLRSEVIMRIEEGNNEVVEFARRFSEEVVKCQLETAWSFGVFYDLLNWETDIIRSGIFEWAMKELEEKGALYLEKEGGNKGCLMIRLRDVDEFRRLKSPDEVLMRSDGTATYVGKDIAYAAWKLGLTPMRFKVKDWMRQPNGRMLLTTHSSGVDYEFPGADLAVTVVDKRQEYPQMVVKQALKMLGMSPGKEYYPYLYEVVAMSGETASEITSIEEYRGRRIVHMSGRKGIVFNADSLLKTVFQKVYGETRRRNPSRDEEWVRRVSMGLSTSSIRYSLLKTDRNNIIVFDIKDATRLEGDTAPYLQYTYARACRILEKTGLDMDSIEEIRVDTPEEWSLVKQISKFSWVLDRACKEFALNSIAIYMRQLADVFNSFYEKCPVITGEGVRRDRLAIVKAFMITIGNAFDITGIEKLDEI